MAQPTVQNTARAICGTRGKIVFIDNQYAIATGSEMLNRPRTVNSGTDHNDIKWILVKIGQWYTFHDITVNSMSLT
jgi:hypothetical protein